MTRLPLRSAIRSMPAEEIAVGEHLDGVGAGRQDLLGHEAAALVDGHGTPGHPDLVAVGHVVAAHADRAAAQADVVQAQRVLAISRE